MRASSLAPQNGQTGDGSLKSVTGGASSMYSVSRTPTTRRSKMIWQSPHRNRTGSFSVMVASENVRTSHVLIGLAVRQG